MAFGLNRAEVIGRLGADVTVNHLASGGRVANLSVATDESYIDRQSGERVDRTEWHRFAMLTNSLDLMGHYATVAQRFLRMTCERTISAVSKLQDDSFQLLRTPARASRVISAMSRPGIATGFPDPVSLTVCPYLSSDLLTSPTSSRRTAALSGGGQRRLSVALFLRHQRPSDARSHQVPPTARYPIRSSCSAKSGCARTSPPPWLRP